MNEMGGEERVVGMKGVTASSTRSRGCRSELDGLPTRYDREASRVEVERLGFQLQRSEDVVVGLIVLDEASESSTVTLNVSCPTSFSNARRSSLVKGDLRERDSVGGLVGVPS